MLPVGFKRELTSSACRHDILVGIESGTPPKWLRRQNRGRLRRNTIIIAENTDKSSDPQKLLLRTFLRFKLSAE